MKARQRIEQLTAALQRLLNAFEADARISPGMPVVMSLETNGGAIRQAKEALHENPYCSR